jgi:hypothetical protein
MIKKFYSQAGQDAWVLQQVLDYKIGGYFVDIGAFDGIHLNNTYWLERIVHRGESRHIQPTADEPQMQSDELLHWHIPCCRYA